MQGDGYTTLFELRGMPVRVHWSVLLGMLLVGGGLRWAPAMWLGYVLVLIVHELGHAALARSQRLIVYGVEVHGFGGVCFHEPARSALSDSVIAWGGVLGQLLAFAVASVLTGFVPSLRVGLAGDLVRVLSTWNLAVAAFNLLPFGPFDGARAWRLPALLYRRFSKRRSRARQRTRGPERRAPRRDAGEVPNLRLVRDDDGDFRFEIDADENERQR